ERAAIDLIVWTTMVPARGSTMGAPTLSTDIGRPPPGPGAMVLEGPGVGLGSPADTPGPLATRTTIAIALAHRARDLLVLCIVASPAVMGIALPSLRSEVNLLDRVGNLPCRSTAMAPISRPVEPDPQAPWCATSPCEGAVICSCWVLMTAFVRHPTCVAGQVRAAD